MPNPIRQASDSGSRPWRFRRIDGRWMAVALVAAYFAALFLGGDAESTRARWKRVGVIATTPSFLDLRLFPAAQAELSAGGDPYVANPRDPKERPYNYSRAWLAFMRFPNDEPVVVAIGITLALAALAAVLWFWGRLTLGEGAYAGLLLCTPAIMLGVEKGNTDLIVFVLVVLGLAALGKRSSARSAGVCAAIWLGAAGLKLYPLIAFAALPARSIRAWLKMVGVPFVIFAVYVAATLTDVAAALRNTGMGWIQAYGVRVPVLAAQQALSYYKSLSIDGPRWTVVATVITGLLFCSAAIWGWRRRSAASGRSDAGPPVAAVAGFRAGALIYVGTFLVGMSFDYRKCFLLLTLPQLFQWQRSAGGPLRAPARFALASLLLSAGINYVVAGWTGFVVKVVSELLLGCSLVALLAAERGRIDTSREIGTSPAPG